MDIVLVLLAMACLGDAVRLRRRAMRLSVLAPSDAPVSPSHVFLVAEGVTLDDATRRAASAHATAHGLEVLDLVPQRASAFATMSLLRVVDPSKYRGDPFARGCTTGHAVLVDRGTLARARVSESTPESALDLWRRVGRLKRFAARTTDLAIAPGLTARKGDPHHDRAVVRDMLALAADFDWLVVSIPALIAALLVLAVVTHPVTGLALLGAYQIQLLLALGATPLRPRRLLLATLFRALAEGGLAVQLLARREGPSPEEALRPVYDELLKDGTARFFAPRLASCPMCGSASLGKLFTTSDYSQHKPGAFTLESCADCRHVFQNPRLSGEGLSFYYRDFYDGLGDATVESVFAAYGPVYGSRVDMVKQHATPESWLDVGCGHGHFCAVAREALPAMTLHGLDQSEGAEDAMRRGFLDRAHRSAFIDFARDTSERYDVVSMHHYLEHVTDPEGEIAAARRIVRPGGHLMIEVPDPDSKLARLFGRNWVLWLPPQHLHFVTRDRIETMLRAHGFEPVQMDLGKAHMPIDLGWLFVVMLQRLGPLRDLPWRPRESRIALVGRRLAWVLSAPVLIAAAMADKVLAKRAESLGVSNLYRVLARRVPEPDESRLAA